MANKKSTSKATSAHYWDTWSLKEKLNYLKKHKGSRKKIDQLLSDCCNANLIGRIFTLKEHGNDSLDLAVELMVEGEKQFYTFEKVSPIPSNVRSKIVNDTFGEPKKESSITVNGKKSILKKEYGEENWVSGSNGVSILKKFKNLHEQNHEASQVGSFIIKKDAIIDEVKGLDSNQEEKERIYWLNYEDMQEKLKKGDEGGAKDILCRQIKALFNHREHLDEALMQIKDMDEISKIKPLSLQINLYLNYLDSKKAA